MILVTGGAGYIGSHTVLALLLTHHDVVVFDNLSNSSLESLKRVEKLTGRIVTFIEGDVRDSVQLKTVFQNYPIEAVIHFAGLKAVGESVAEPLRYYENNVQGTLSLIRVMADQGVKNLVFSSSATVYGLPENCPIDESAPLFAINPYGQSKLMLENILRDVAAADSDWHIALLRYFNPVGAHESGLLGEDPNGIPNNLMPYISQVAVGKLPYLNVFGDDYDTPDGTGVRDYIHVMDLAEGHLAALDVLPRQSGAWAVNLGTGQGYSVLDLVKAFEKACGKDIPYKIAPRREGDAGTCFASVKLAETMLHWQAKRDLFEICASSWKWQSLNPNGYS